MWLGGERRRRRRRGRRGRGTEFEVPGQHTESPLGDKGRLLAKKENVVEVIFDGQRSEMDFLCLHWASVCWDSDVEGIGWKPWDGRMS